jgi:hypothetical protein
VRTLPTFTEHGQMLLSAALPSIALFKTHQLLPIEIYSL